MEGHHHHEATLASPPHVELVDLHAVPPAAVEDLKSPTPASTSGGVSGTEPAPPVRRSARRVSINAPGRPFQTSIPAAPAGNAAVLVDVADNGGSADDDDVQPPTTAQRVGGQLAKAFLGGYNFGLLAALIRLIIMAGGGALSGGLFTGSIVTLAVSAIVGVVAAVVAHTLLLLLYMGAATVTAVLSAYILYFCIVGGLSGLVTVHEAIALLVGTTLCLVSALLLRMYRLLCQRVEVAQVRAAHRALAARQAAEEARLRRKRAASAAHRASAATSVPLTPVVSEPGGRHALAGLALPLPVARRVSATVELSPHTGHTPLTMTRPTDTM